MDALIKPRRIAKIIGLVTTGFFLVIALGLFWAGEHVAAACFLPFVLLGVALLVAYKRQYVLIKEQALVIGYVLKETQQVRYEEIRCLLMVPLSNKVELVLVGKRYERLLELDMMYDNLDALFVAMERHDIDILDFGEMVESGQNVSKYLPALSVVARNYYQTVCNETETMEDLRKDRDAKDYEGTKRILKIIGWGLILADAVGFLIGGKTMVAVFTVVILVSYGIYLWYYPYIYMELTTKKGQALALQMPFMGAGIAVLLSLFVTNVWGYDFGVFVKYMVFFMAVLLLPFIVKSFRTEAPQSFGRKLSVVFATFMMAFTITMPINYLLTFDKSTHESTVIIDKDIDTSGKTTDYYVYGMWRGEKTEFPVTSSEYDEIEVGDAQRICIKKSLLGFEYYGVHE